MNKKIGFFFFIAFIMLSAVSQTRVMMYTSMGEIELLLSDETPKHRDNFIKLIEEGFYDSVLFHRVIPNFMIQAGDPNSKPKLKNSVIGGGGPGYTIEAEIRSNLIHKKGALAAARLGDDENPSRRSSGSQFYLVQGRVYPRKYMNRFEEKRGEPYTEEQLKVYEQKGGTPHLDGQYTVFGEIKRGMEVLNTIAAVEIGRADRPKRDVYIIKMKIIK